MVRADHPEPVVSAVPVAYQGSVVTVECPEPVVSAVPAAYLVSAVTPEHQVTAEHLGNLDIVECLGSVVTVARAERPVCLDRVVPADQVEHLEFPERQERVV